MWIVTRESVFAIVFALKVIHVSQSMALVLGLSAAIVLLVGLSTCLVPTRRILAVQASEAMHADG